MTTGPQWFHGRHRRNYADVVVLLLLLLLGHTNCVYSLPKYWGALIACNYRSISRQTFGGLPTSRTIPAHKRCGVTAWHRKVHYRKTAVLGSISDASSPKHVTESIGSLRRNDNLGRMWDVEDQECSRQSVYRWRLGCRPYTMAALYLQHPNSYIRVSSVQISSEIRV
jgi:hypothetical protein